jgi:predicted NAD-dependent protein-ADP-ribosyltransferase YbiA (DUF1768 family)
VEHWVVVSKALLFGAKDIAHKILDCDDLLVVKLLGQSLNGEGFDPQMWQENQEAIRYWGNLIKFTYNSVDQEVLLCAGDKELVVGNDGGDSSLAAILNQVKNTLLRGENHRNIPVQLNTFIQESYGLAKEGLTQ